MNNRGQLQIIAAMLVAVILVGTIMVTFSQLRNSSIQETPQILSATDEIQLAINQILCTTIRYYGSVLQVTGNSSYARNAAQTFLYNQTANIPSMYPAWGISLNVTGISLRVNWFSNYSYSNGTLSMTYDLKGLGLSNISYNASSSLAVQANSGATIGQASLTISEDAGSPATNLGTQNFGFYSYNYTNSTWNVVNPSAFLATLTNGTYVINLPQGVDSNSYIVQVIDQRGLMTLASSSNYLTSSLNWNASLNSYPHYVDVSGMDVDLNGEFGSHSNFTAQQYGPDSACDTLTEAPVISTHPNAYYPSNFILQGLTQNVSGSLANLQTDDGSYMGFSSWASATSATSLYSQQTTASVGGSSYYTLAQAVASQAGLALNASMSSVGRTLLGKMVYPLTGVNTINASTWTVNYRAWEDSPFTNIARDNVGSGLNSIVGYVPITITNNQSSATPNPFQEKITWNPSTYASYEASGLGNIRFYSDSALTNLLYAWLESCTPTLSNTATSATAWIKLTSPIAASGGTLTVYMAFLSTSTNFDGNYWGDAPNLSGTYGIYDNGANVFSFYDNFNGTSLNSKWTSIIGSSGASIAVNNGLTVTTTSTGSTAYAFVISANQPYPAVAETYTSSGNSILGVATTKSLNGFIAPYSGYSMDWYAGSDDLEYQRSSGGVNLRSISQPTFPTGVWQVTWSATSSQYFADGAGNTYTGTNSGVAIANYGIYVGQSNGVISSSIFRWARMRAYPPSNVMPSVSLGTTGFLNKVSWSHTTGSGSNRIMIVGASIKSSSVSVSSITYGSQSLTFIRRDTNSNGTSSELWYLIAPASGTATVTVNLSNSAIVTGGSCTYTGVSQASPIDAHNGGSGTSASPSQSVTVNTANSFLISNIAINGTAAVSSEGSGQTQRWDQYYSNLIRGHGSEEGPDGTGSQSISWTLSGSAGWAVSVVSLKPATIPAVGHCDVDILIRKSDGTIRTNVTTSNAASIPLTSSASTLSGTYAWSNYSVVAQTDYLEFDFYANTTTALAGATAYLMIDNSTLTTSQQTHVDNVYLPSQYTSAVVFEGVSDSQTWTQLNWTINSQCTTAGVTVTCQLYNFNTSSYPTSGDGYQTATVGTTDVIQSQTISTNPTYYRNGTNWFRMIAQCVNTTITQFYWNCDLVQYFRNYTTTNYRLDLEEQWMNVNYNNPDQLAIYQVGSGSENMEVDFWNGTAWSPVLSSLASGWNNASISSYATSSNFTIRFLDGNQAGDTVQNSWQIDAALVRTNSSWYAALELLQNGTTLWLGQPLANLTSRPIPPIAVKAFHVNQTISGVEREMPFQIEDWASNYRVPLGLSSNVSVFSGENMLVCLVTPQVTAIKVWWNGSDDAVQTPFAYTNNYFTVDTVQRTATNGILNLTIDFSSGAFHITSTVGNSSCTSELFRINNVVSSYGAAEPNYAITNGPVRIIIHHEVEWSSNGVPNCYDTLAHLVITLPANATYYTYALRLMFLNTTTTRTITDLCPIKLNSTINTIQTENGTAAGYPTVTSTTGLFYNQSQTKWAHHWSQFISGTTGAGIMFTDNDTQRLYVFDSPTVKTGAINTDPIADKIELLPVNMSQISLPNPFDVTWHGAVVTFDGTTPIYDQATRNGLWIIVEYPPSLA